MNLELFAPIQTESFNGNGRNYTFIDLFAGIGGFHLALSSLGAKCVFASEKDNFARQTYCHNFDTSQFEFNDDIRKISPNLIANHDILCAGFPCQPFSQAGLKKGFNDGKDSERGNLFFCILDIIEQKQPKAFILENVRHLVSHDNGKTFTIILNLLENAGYTVYHKVLKASDYNIPQHRPRVFIIGFKNADCLPPFQFPEKQPLTYTMSDIFGEPCEKQIGFTLRVGGKGSNIDDRRNWEFYRVNGEVKRIGIREAKKMMAIPDEYEFPVSKTQAMKQLGNSVCVEVVRQIAKQVLAYLNEHYQHFYGIKQMEIKRNKGELSEIYALCKVISEQIIAYGDVIAKPTSDFIQIIKIHTHQSTLELDKTNITITNNIGESQQILLSDFISQEQLAKIITDIKEGKNTFNSKIIDQKVKILNLEKTKGTSFEKGDISLSFIENTQIFNEQNTSIKSFLGSSPTLLNASQATNFIYEVKNLTADDLDTINKIDGKAKIKNRLAKILALGGSLHFTKCENPIYESTLRKVDTQMPEILAGALLAFFHKKFGNRLAQYPDYQFDNKQAEQVHCRLKDFVKSTILGIFPTHEWDGNLTANAVLLVTKLGELVFYHTNKDSVLKEFFYQHTFFDTPSSSRHRFGNLYYENGKLYFKLNLQLRLADK